MLSAETLRIEMQQAIRELGSGAPDRKRQIERAGEITGLGPTLAERLRDKKIKYPRAHIVDVVRAARDTLREATADSFVGRIAKRVAARLAEEQKRQEAKARDELTTLAARLAYLEQRLCVVDQDFFGEEVLPSLQSARGEINSLFELSGADRPGSDGEAEAVVEGPAE